MDSLTDVQYQVRTLLGTSDVYKPNSNRDSFGTGQGSGVSPTFWNLIEEILLNTMDDYSHGMKFQNPIKKMINERTEDAFVDDKSLGVEGINERVMERLQKTYQQQEQDLLATGGKIESVVRIDL